MYKVINCLFAASIFLSVGVSANKDYTNEHDFVGVMNCVLLASHFETNSDGELTRRLSVNLKGIASKIRNGVDPLKVEELIDFSRHKTAEYLVENLTVSELESENYYNIRVLKKAFKNFNCEPIVDVISDHYLNELGTFSKEERQKQKADIIEMLYAGA